MKKPVGRDPLPALRTRSAPTRSYFLCVDIVSCLKDLDRSIDLTSSLLFVKVDIMLPTND
jgi:hypothetical protein